jgi:hypothetical protein
MIAEPRKSTVESSYTGKKIDELNVLHVSSLAANVFQASLRLVFNLNWKSFNLWCHREMA